MDDYTRSGHLTWVPMNGGSGEVYRCHRCRALTDDREGHTASHAADDARWATITPGAFKAAEPQSRPSKVAQWRDAASIEVVDETHVTTTAELLDGLVVEEYGDEIDLMTPPERRIVFAADPSLVERAAAIAARYDAGSIVIRPDDDAIEDEAHRAKYGEGMDPRGSADS